MYKKITICGLVLFVLLSNLFAVTYEKGKDYDSFRLSEDEQPMYMLPFLMAASDNVDFTQTSDDIYGEYPMSAEELSNKKETGLSIVLEKNNKLTKKPHIVIYDFNYRTRTSGKILGNYNDLLEITKTAFDVN